ncbi:ABC transporter substrate-binding protein [Tepidicella baoligensis]|uniref:ABC transporter substrate-binding protein n=1 Tax=Tepidicella baoligensis TaxID=2707016 RepID=UPI0015D9A910|nr:ABC transporter substrate-binding protein [Tepidicella baoligensis]
MKKILTVAALAATLALGAHAQTTVKIGVLLGYTGPIESLTPAMAASAELAMKEVSDSGLLLGGAKVQPVRADSTCVDAAAATAAAERLVTSERVAAIVGADCSGVTTAVVQNVAVPRGVLMISPSATSPALSTVRDNGLFFRTAPSDARQGEVIAEMLREKGIRRAALTFTNNDYGRGLANSIQTHFEKLGGRITISAAHEDGKGDYTAEVAALAAAGGDILVVAGYVDQGGRGIIRSALDSGAFSRFFLPDGMIGDSLPQAIGRGLNGSFGVAPGTDSPGGQRFETIAKAANINIGPYTHQSYDAAALILLGMQAAKSTDSAKVKEKIMEIANGPGEKIYAGELAKGLKILAEGGKINYEGASAVRFIEPGESAGSYRVIEVRNGRMETVGFR